MDNSTREASATDALIMNNVSSTPVSEIAARSASLILIALLSFFGNCLVCITLYRRPYLLTPSNKLVFSLTTSNFVFSILVLPFVITGSITEQWYFGKVWCAITGFLTLLVMGASMLILAAIACDRYYAIVHPMLYPQIITGFRATVAIIVCWVLAAVCAAPPLFGAWSRYEFQPSRCGCMPVWQQGLGFTIFWFILCFFIPYFMMLCCYGCIFKVARTKTRQVHSRVESPSKSAGQNQFLSDDTSSNSSDGSYTEVSDAFPTTRVIGSNSITTTQQAASNGKLSKCADVNDNSSTMEDSGIMVSDCAPAPPSFDNHTPRHSRKQSLENGRTYLPNQVENKDSPKSAGRGNCNEVEVSNMSQVESELQLRNSRKSSNASIVSSTSQVLRRTSLAFSAVRYYSNQMKAVFTIAFILGILLVTMGPFVIVAHIEARWGNASSDDSPPPSPVPRMTLSISTCFMYLTCVYYPLIYGLWNRTVRKEMRYLLCGQKNDHHNLRKTRILSLTTHIQDLGMSPGLTAAIIGESDPVNFNENLFRDRHLRASSRHIRSSKENNMLVAASKRRHTLHTLSSGSLLAQAAANTPSPIAPTHRHKVFAARLKREHYNKGRTNIGVIAEESDQEETSSNNSSSNNIEPRRWRHDYEIKTVSIAVPEMEVVHTPNAQEVSSSGYKMRIQTKDDVLVPVTYPHSRKAIEKFPSRAREKPATGGLLELSSSEVLNSTALSSALLFAGYDHRSRRNPRPSIQRALSDPTDRPSENVKSHKITEHKLLSKAELAVALGNGPVSQTASRTIQRPVVIYEKSGTDNDKISVITEGRLRGSNLIHLEAGEPKNMVKWSSGQFVDFFASSIAYGVVEAGKSKLREDERPPSRN